MSERKQQILEAAIEIIANEGYANLSMRALARASDLKLGALQYHYKTREDMLRAVVGYIADEYQKSFDEVALADGFLGVQGFIDFITEDKVDEALNTSKLWPQLWAMGAIEPLVADLVAEIYDKYLNILEGLLKDVGSEAPRAEALFLMSMVEGSTLFLGRNKPWEADEHAVRDVLQRFIESQYGQK